MMEHATASSGGIAGWRDVLARCRHAGRGRYDLRPYWRSRGYENAASASECERRAHAFASVLAHIPLHHYAGERIAGSRAGFCVDSIPAGLDPADYEAAVVAEKDRGQRTFQAGFDHACPDYDTLLRVGIAGLRGRVDSELAACVMPSERHTLLGFRICLDGLSTFIARHRDLHLEMGNREVAEVLTALNEGPPQTFHQALQLIWMVHTAFVSEGRYAMALGRLDQLLFPFYARDLRTERLTSAEALDLLCHLWCRVEELGEVTNITIGGQTPAGEDAANDVSYLCLEATRLVQSPHTNLSARLWASTEERFHRACFACIRTGVGFPALFNDDVLIPGLVEIGIPPAVARDYCLVGCIETHFPGRQQAWGDGVPGFAGESNIQCLERALRVMRSESQRSYERLIELFREHLRVFFEECACRVNAYIERYPPARFPDPFLSVLTRDCIGRRRDINAGGAQIARFYKCAGGENLATLADALAAVKLLVFEREEISYDQLLVALEVDFQGFEALRQRLLHRAPKYGNDDTTVDGIAADMLDLITAEIDRLPQVHGGGRFVACAAGNIHNIVRGKQVGATADGRHAGEPLSDATSPHFGRDRFGPTAVLRSMSRTSCSRIFGGRVANMKFDPAHFQGDAGADRFCALTTEMVQSGIQELQINFTDNATLLAARDCPEQHRDLVVRVSGFSAYFTQLRPEVQDDVIRRRAHG